jgi:transcriptional regulator with XRE-family HTH domain
MAKYDPMSTFCQNVSDIMHRHGWTNNDLADALGVDVSWVSKVRNRKNSPTIKTAQRMADALGVQLWQLFLPQPQGSKKVSA